MGFFSGIAGRIKSMAESTYASAGFPEPEAYYPGGYPYPGRASYGNGGGKQIAGLTNDGIPLYLNAGKIMINARRAVHDSPHAKVIVDTLADSVIGTGLKFESAIKFEVLGITQEEAQRIGKEIETRFDLWASSKKATRDGSMNFYQSQKLYVKSQTRDGEVFVRYYYSNRKDLISPVQISFVDPTQIIGANIQTTGLPFNFDDGIERNAQGEETGYKITVQDNTKPYTQKIVKIPAKMPRSRRVSMIHGFAADYAGQRRGISAIGHVLQDFQMIEDFTIATKQKAIEQSNILGWVEPSEDAPASDILEGMGTQIAGPRSLVEPVIDGTEVIDYNREVCLLPEATMAGPGSKFFVNLQPGEDIKFAPAASNTETSGAFVDSNMKWVAASCGASNEILTKQWGSSFSASRATLLQFQETKEDGRAETAADFLNVTLEAFVAEDVAAGRLNLPGFSDPALRAAWLSGKWPGSGVPNIDPVKEATASEKNLSLSRTTLERESKGLNGSDAAANLMKNKESFDEMPKLYTTKAAIEEEKTESQTPEDE